MRYFIVLIVFFGIALRAQDTTTHSITVGAFVDTYYMYDFNSPGRNQKSHPFTQPSRHNEFNVNLTHIAVRLNSPSIRGALALHTGTSVRANYAAEADNRELAQLIHEAWGGYQVADNLWIDAGIYPAPYGLESWLSRDNKTYTRSLVADYSPYYQTGAKASWQASEAIGLTLHVINGWQNIAETNTDKAFGLSLAYTPSNTVSISYNNFVGNEQPDSAKAATRFFNNLCLRFIASDDLGIDLTADYGMQNKGSWGGIALIGRYQLSKTVAIALRGEYYKDAQQVILTTGTPEGFDGFGASANVDVTFTPQLLWRTELRVLNTKHPVFPSENILRHRTGFAVSSFALTL